MAIDSGHNNEKCKTIVLKGIRVFKMINRSQPTQFITFINFMSCIQMGTKLEELSSHGIRKS